MTHRVHLIGAVILAAATAAPAYAGVADELRCDALMMRQEGRHYLCLGRCERRADQRLPQIGEEAEVEREACAASCDQKLEAHLARTQKRRVCAGDPPPSPDANRCNAKLMRIEARHLTCQSRCQRRADARPEFDKALCDQRCDDRNATAVDNALSQPICVGVSFSSDEP